MSSTESRERYAHNHHKPQSSSPTYVLHFFQRRKKKQKKTIFPASLIYLLCSGTFQIPFSLSLSPSFPCVCKWSPTQQPFIFPFLIEFHNTIAYILYLVYIYTIIHVILLYDFFVSFFFLLALFRKKNKQKTTWVLV